jgi:hypothetical protein
VSFERPLPATVLGAPIEVLSVETGGYRQGLRARCRRAGQQWEVTLIDVAFGSDVDPELALTLAAYRPPRRRPARPTNSASSNNGEAGSNA